VQQVTRAISPGQGVQLNSRFGPGFRFAIAWLAYGSQNSAGWTPLTPARIHPGGTCVPRTGAGWSLAE